MPLSINTRTGIIRDYPLNIIRHRILGRNLELYIETEEVEEDKVVMDKKVSRRAKVEDILTVVEDESPTTEESE